MAGRFPSHDDFPMNQSPPFCSGYPSWPCLRATGIIPIISYDIPTVFVGHIPMLVGSITLILQCLRKQEKIRNVPYRFPSSGIPIAKTRNNTWNKQTQVIAITSRLSPVARLHCSKIHLFYLRFGFRLGGRETLLKRRKQTGFSTKPHRKCWVGNWWVNPTNRRKNRYKNCSIGT